MGEPGNLRFGAEELFPAVEDATGLNENCAVGGESHPRLVLVAVVLAAQDQIGELVATDRRLVGADLYRRVDVALGNAGQDGHSGRAGRLQIDRRRPPAML
jgi:hypothetical protein